MNLANKLYSRLKVAFRFYLNGKALKSPKGKELGNNFQRNVLVKVQDVNKQDMSLYDEFCLKTVISSPVLNQSITME